HNPLRGRLTRNLIYSTKPRSNVMFIAIGVIAKEKEHIDVLKEIASIFSDELIANALSLISDKHDFLKILQHNALPH
ncbi:hypothetical protein ACLBPX_29630, partial [Klebsiella pneumoniae]